MQRHEILSVGLITLVVAVAIALVPTERTGSPGANRLDWSTANADLRERVELSWCGAPAFPSADTGTEVQRLIERTFNVQITPVFLDWNAYRNRRSLSFSAGDVPTVCWDGDPTQLRRQCEQRLRHRTALRRHPKICTPLRRADQPGRAAGLALSACERPQLRPADIRGQRRFSLRPGMAHGLASQRRHRSGAPEPRRDARGALAV